MPKCLEKLLWQDLGYRQFLDFDKGEFVSPPGSYGSGKTNCLMILAGFETVTRGSVLIDGTPHSARTGRDQPEQSGYQK